ncbi:Uncharacterised protein [uncultured archaeon]|nr:Uncharacterised protein [uncultured archaeon]
MSIFLSLRDSELTQPCSADHLTQSVARVLRWKGHRNLQGGIVLSHAGVADANRIYWELMKIAIYKSPGDLACSVGPEVEEDYAVSTLHQPGTVHDCGLQELVVLTALVAILYRFFGRFRFEAFSLDEAAISLLNSLPALIPVHGVVAPRDRGHPAHAQLPELLLQLPKIGQSASGRDVPAVKNGVHINPLQTLFLCHLQKGIQVGVVAVHAAIGEQAHQMQPAASGLLHGLQQNRILVKSSILHGQADPGIVLVNDPSAAQVEVSHLRVAHLPSRQTDGQAR